MLTKATWCSKAAVAARTSSDKASSEASATCRASETFVQRFNDRAEEELSSQWQNLHIAMGAQLPQLVHDI